MTKSEVKTLGHWPSDFLEGLVSEIPPISVSGQTKLNGLTRIYDCGKMKFVKEYE